jgi:hypothetical protein
MALMVIEIVVGGYSLSTTVYPPTIPGVPFHCGGVDGPVGWITGFWINPLVFDTVTFA